ncbi:MAG TPA: hypothetical protein DEB31_10315 [Clostridiales bacterium]|nr:hypothetical protein [Clostridiales bacterium]
MANETSNQTGGEQSRASMNTAVRKVAGKSKAAGIIVSICMIVLGVLFLVRPLITAAIAMYFATVAFVIYGVYQILAYIRTEAGARNGWTLANGIIFTILGVLLLMGGVFEMAFMFVFLLAFLAISSGVNHLAAYSVIKKSGEPGAGLILASGLINLLLGIFMLVMPYAGFLATEMLVGIYMVVGGFALFAESASGHSGRRPGAVA